MQAGTGGTSINVWYLILVPIIAFLSNLIIKFVEGAMAKRAKILEEQASEKKTREIRNLELETIGQQTELEVLKQVIGRAQTLEGSVDDLRAKIEEGLRREADRLTIENFSLRSNLNVAMLIIEISKRNGDASEDCLRIAKEALGGRCNDCPVRDVVMQKLN